MKYLQVKLTDDIHKKFKQWCFYNEMDMSTVIRTYIEQELKQTDIEKRKLLGL